MKQYKTVDVDYADCHPVIAEALKQGKHIWCRYENCNPILITGFVPDCRAYPYIGLNRDKSPESYHKDMKPIETKKKFKSAPEIIQWCIDSGWVPPGNEVIVFAEPYKSHTRTLNSLHINLIKFYAGKEYKPDEIHEMYIHPEWLEEME